MQTQTQQPNTEPRRWPQGETNNFAQATGKTCPICGSDIVTYLVYDRADREWNEQEWCYGSVTTGGKHLAEADTAQAA